MKRLRLLDILRGFAILGTLGTNIWIFASLGELDLVDGGNSTAADIKWWESMDTTIMVIFNFFTNGKFLALLTILFGAGLELKRRKLQKTKGLWPWVYIWTAVLLLLDGFIHFLLVFEYDILMSYAVTAIIVSFIVMAKKKVVKWIIGICVSLHLLIVAGLSISTHLMINDPELKQTFIEEMANISQIYLNGSWFEQVQMRFTGFWGLRSEAIFVIPMNIILFMLGVWFVRSGIFAMDEEGKRKRKKLLVVGLALGVPLNALTFVPIEFLGVIVRYLFAPLLSVGYLALFAIILEKAENSMILARLEEVGKIALSCYILQNIVSSILFYGWGFGLGNNFSGIKTLIIYIGICLFMILFANIWLRFFKLGPVEYVWRSLGNLPLRGKKQGTEQLKAQ